VPPDLHDNLALVHWHVTPQAVLARVELLVIETYILAIIMGVNSGYVAVVVDGVARDTRVVDVDGMHADLEHVLGTLECRIPEGCSGDPRLRPAVLGPRSGF
jgi:hypothetical protein